MFNKIQRQFLIRNPMTSDGVVGLPSRFSTVVCHGENVPALGLDFGKQTTAWRRLQWPDCSANEMK